MGTSMVSSFRWRFSQENQSIETWLTWQFPKNFETGKNDWKAYWTARISVFFPWFNRHIFKGWIPDFKAPCTIVGYPMTSQFDGWENSHSWWILPQVLLVISHERSKLCLHLRMKKHVVDPTCCVSPMFIPSRGMLGCFDIKKTHLLTMAHMPHHHHHFPLKVHFFP